MSGDAREADALAAGDTEPSARITVDREAFRQLCVEAGGAIGALQACSTYFAKAAGLSASAKTTAGAADDLRASLSAAVASARPS